MQTKYVRVQYVKNIIIYYLHFKVVTPHIITIVNNIIKLHFKGNRINRDI